MLPRRRWRSFRSGGEAEDRHHLGGDGDVEAVAAREPVPDPAEGADDLAQRPIVHIDHAPPRHAPGVEPERVALMDVIVEQRRQQVVRGADGMEIAGEVQVDVLHRYHLRVAAARGSAFHAEAWSEARLAQTDQRLLSDPVQSVGQSDRCGRLAFTRWGRGDRGDQYELAVLPVGERLDVAEVDLRLRVSIRQQCLRWDPQPVADLRNRLLHRLPGNFDVALGQRLILLAGSWSVGPDTSGCKAVAPVVVRRREDTEYVGYSRPMFTWWFSARREADRLNRDAATLIDMARAVSSSERIRDVALRVRDELEVAHARGGSDPSRYAPLINHFKTQHREARRQRDDDALTALTLVIIYLRAEGLGPGADPARDSIDNFISEWQHASAASPRGRPAG